MIEIIINITTTIARTNFQIYFSHDLYGISRAVKPIINMKLVGNIAANVPNELFSINVAAKAFLPKLFVIKVPRI